MPGNFLAHLGIPCAKVVSYSALEGTVYTIQVVQCKIYLASKNMSLPLSFQQMPYADCCRTGSSICIRSIILQENVTKYS